MALSPGSRLGPHEILSPLGAGGMGEVYRARDTRLQRDVAIKVLPEHLARSPELRQRFEREARAVSSLNHPHICTLHDVGHQGGIDYIVMELMEGETLADRLKRGPMPLDQVLRVAVEIADALEKAHRQGVVHRDLKPGNVMLTKAGSKLMDFGLATSRRSSAASDSDLSVLATIAKPLTERGTLLGTVQYMAPEQLEGKEADARADIWALGCVVYEMATGRRAFEGKSQASLISAVLKDEPPPISGVRPMTPPALDRLVNVCLAKDPDERLQTAHDVMQELKWIAEGGSGAGPVVARGARGAAWTVALLAVVASGIAGWALGRRGTGGRPGGDGPAMRLSLTFSPDAPLKAENRVGLALSPDGTRLVYVGGDKESTRLYVRDLDQLESKPIPGSELAGTQEGNPFFSPDGRWIAFFADGKLKKVSLEGGPPVVLCDAPTGRGGSWGDDDSIVFAPSLTSGLSRVPAAGGAPEVLTRPDPKNGETSHRWPQVLPGGKAVVFTIGTGGSWDSARVGVLSLEARQVKSVVEGGCFPRYVPTGHLTFTRGGRLMAVPFDLEKREPLGTPIPVLDGVETNRTGAGAAELVFSGRGALLYLPSELPDRSIVWVARDGKVDPLPTPVRAYLGLALSPGSDRVALLADDGSNEDIWIYELGRGTLTRLTFGGQNEGLVWTPDGKRLTFSSAEAGRLQNVVWAPADGSGKPEPLTTGEGGWQWPRSWSPDGRTLLFNATQPGTDYDIWLLPVGDRAEPRPFLQTPFDERNAVVSPDGRWVAYQSNETGRPEIYVRAFPGPGGKQQISSDGGVDPVWARSGRELFYREGEDMRRVMAVAVDTGPELRALKPRVLFEGRFWGGLDTPDWAASPDGRRFLMIRPSEREATQRHVNVVLGWFDELSRLVPTPRR